MSTCHWMNKGFITLLLLFLTDRAINTDTGIHKKKTQIQVGTYHAKVIDLGEKKSLAASFIIKFLINGKE